MTADVSLITVQRHEGFAIVALNRPERRNALVPDLLAEFDRVMGELDDDPEIAGGLSVGPLPLSGGGAITDAGHLESGPINCTFEV